MTRLARLLVAIVCIASPALVVAEPPATAPAVAKPAAVPAALNGDWAVTQVVIAGQTPPAEQMSAMTISIVGNRMIPSNAPDQAVTFVTDENQSPKWFDVAERGQSGLGIYKVEDDMLTICTGMPGTNVRPTAFESTPASQTLLLVLTRQAAEPTTAPSTQPTR